MQEVFEKIIRRIEVAVKSSDNSNFTNGLLSAQDIIKQEAEQYNNGWIPCSEKMPPVETEVLVLAKRKFDESYCYITTMAMYEDGSVSECDSCWIWEDIEGDWDEENDCYIIPQGWWESRHYNPDDIYNNAVDDEVVAWQPMPPEYKESGERPKKTNFDRCCESVEAMAQIIEIAKIGWTKNQIMEWLQKEVDE